MRNRRKSNRCNCTSRLGIIIGVMVLVIVVVLSVTLSLTLTNKGEPQPKVVPMKWWQNGSIYRVYVASFADSDGDGIGDFKG